MKRTWWSVTAMCLGWSLCSMSTGAEPAVISRRFEAQRALDRVAFGHQVMPPGTSSPAVSFEQAYPASSSLAKVEKALLESEALEVYWQRPITGEQLQAEMDRMVKGSKDPKVLAEMFSALGNSPRAIAEYLARPLLADRLCRQWYARDERFHGDLKSRALIQLEGLTAQTLRSAGGRYTEYEIKENTSEIPAARSGEAGLLDAAEWKSAVSHLAEVLSVPSETAPESLPAGRVSALQEDDTRFYALAVLEAAPRGAKVALVQWPKMPFDQWLLEQREKLGAQSARIPSYSYRIAPSAVTAVGANDTWSPMTAVPQEREYASAVWTGSEMIVWGGMVAGSPSNSGSRYNPATDTWTLVSTVNAPAARYLHSAVWTGTRMLIWGGSNGIDLSSGSSYDPVADTWTAIADSAATVSGRSYHSTVWTGTEMIVWGGQVSTALVNTGGAYNPSTNSWRATSAPTAGIKTLEARWRHACVWTGSKMILWGGMDTALTPTYFANGMLYDPSTDSWTLMSTAILGARADAFTVWTGTEMIQWGGIQNGVLSFTGIRYNPVTDTWAAVSTTGAPTARQVFNASGFAWWTGSMAGSTMIVWAGWDAMGLTGTGGRYNPATDSWLPTSMVNAQTAAYYASSVWTGSEMIVWGGTPAGAVAPSITGGRYNPVTDSWVHTNAYGIPVGRRDYAAVWTGTEVVIWGGDDGGSTPVIGGGRYTPATDAWTGMATLNAPVPRTRAQGVWTNTEMIVWGGMVSASGTPTDTGGVYNAGTDTWRPMTLFSAPTARNGASLIWTGTRLVAWGGTDGTGTLLNTGGQYDPVTDAWTPTATLNAVARSAHSTVWTGTEMIVWGGYAPTASNTGQRYNPATDTWTDVTVTGAPDARALHSAVWTGSKMLIWGSSAVTLGAIYDPGTNTWSAMSSAGAPSDRYNQVALWTGNEMIIWGGSPSAGAYVNTGGRYRLSADVWSATALAGAPSERGVLPGVWTGSAMVVWSGSQNGFPSCSGGRYWVSPNPAVTGVSPATGPIGGGTSVIITGTALAGATAVSFGGTAATSFVVNSNTQITAISPASIAGTVDIIVTTADGVSAAVPADQYTYANLPILNLQSNSFTDTCIGSGAGSADGFIDPGEDISLSVVVSNTGTATATNVTALLATATPGVTITTASTTLGNIAAGFAASSVTPFVINIGRGKVCGEALAFTLQITSAEGTWSAAINLTVGHYGTPSSVVMYTENFETSSLGVLPAGWTTETVAGSTWTVGGSPSTCSASVYALQYPTSAVTADAWAYTPGQALTAGVTYTLSFNERVTMAIRSHNLSVHVGTAPNHLAMTQIWSAVLNNAICAAKTVTFTVPTSGTHYIGFHETSLASRLVLAVDDVSLSYLAPPTCIVNPCVANPKEASPAGAGIHASSGLAGAVGVTYTPACGATDHAIYWGTAPIAGALSWSGSACALGATGSATFNPGTPLAGGFFYFVVVGQSATKEGSYGQDSLGVERPTGALAGACNLPQDLTGTCP